MRPPIIVDTGPLYALANRRDTYHDVCREWFLSMNRRDLVVPSLVLAETCQLIEKEVNPSAEARFLRGFGRTAQLAVYDPVPDDYERMADLVDKYRDWPLGAADAAVVVAAERLGTVEVATVDRRHFEHIQPLHVQRFTLYPGR